MSCIILFFIYSLANVNANILQSSSSTITGVCDDLLESIRLLNKYELLKLVDRDNCQDYELLGEKILDLSRKTDKYCYKPLSLILCNLKFVPYEANFNCQHIKEKFMKIIKHCISDKDNNKDCSNVDKESTIINDPFEFCRSNYAVIDNHRVSFDSVEYDYCERIAGSFNLCQLLSKRLNYKRLCLDGGFQNYCTHYVKEIHDDSYKMMCTNFVLPFIFTKLMESPNNLSPSICLGTKVITSTILKKRDDLMNKSQSYEDIIDSELAYKSWSRDLESKMDKLVSNIEIFHHNNQRIDVQTLVSTANKAFNYINYTLNWSYTFDDTVNRELSRSSKIMDGISSVLTHLPDSRDGTFTISKLEGVNNLELKIQEAIIFYKQLYTLISSGSHYYFTVSSVTQYDEAYHPPPLEEEQGVASMKLMPNGLSYTQLLSSLRNSLTEINNNVPLRIAIIRDLVNANPPFNCDVARANRLHDDANHLKYIASLHEAQLSALERIITKTKDSNFIKSLKI